MTVTDVVEWNKTRYKIFIDHEFAFILYKGELRKYKITKGCTLQDDTYRILTEEVLTKRAKLRAMNLLTKQSYTENGLRRKLAEGLYPPEVIEQAVSYVRSYGYVDDMQYTRDYIFYHKERMSRRQIEQKLMQKGISRSCISLCMEETGGGLEEETEQIRGLFQKKYHGVIPEEPAEKRKMMQFFLRKGYSKSTICLALCEKSLGELYN